MGSSAPAELVALFFSQQSRSLQSWKNLLSACSELTKTAFETTRCADETVVRILDEDSASTEGKVFEARLPVSTEPSLQACKACTDSEAMISFQTKYVTHVILQPGLLYAAHRQAGLAVFDMDSTLIQQEVIDELARAVGLYDQVATITEAAMRGEPPYTDFEASLRARVALLKGVPDSIWEQLKRSTITFTPGAPELLRTLKSLGWKTAVLSGGFTPLAYWVKDTLGLDYAYANHLRSDSGSKALTGELVEDAPIIHGFKKRELLLELAAKNNIAVEHVIAVGDGSNDLPMMGVAGLGIAFNAKPKVQLAAPVKLDSPTLLDVMHVLGYSRQEIDQAQAASRPQ